MNHFFSTGLWEGAVRVQHHVGAAAGRGGGEADGGGGANANDGLAHHAHRTLELLLHHGHAGQETLSYYYSTHTKHTVVVNDTAVNYGISILEIP